MEALERNKKIAQMAQQALDSFLGNNSMPLTDVLGTATYELNRTRLERNLVRAERDVAKEELKMLKANKAPESQVAEAQR
jgi:hypothetical protein